MGLADQNRAIRAGIFVTNAIATTALVIMNKQLMTVFNFKFAATISAMHLSATAVVNWLIGMNSGRPRTEIPFRDLLMYIVLSSTSLIAVNTSLALNTVGQYQITKMAALPVAAFLDYITIRKVHAQDAVASMVLIGMGTIAAYIANDTASPAGMAAALAAIVAVAAEQMGGEAMRAHFQIDQVELTARVLPLQACLLLATAPFLDKLLIGSFPHQYEFHVPSMNAMGIAVALAVVANISRYSAFSRMSQTGLDTLGIVKATLVFLAGWVIYDVPDISREIAGAAPAMMGMLFYTYVAYKIPSVIPTPMASDLEEAEEARHLPPPRTRRPCDWAEDIGHTKDQTV